MSERARVRKQEEDLATRSWPIQLVFSPSCFCSPFRQATLAPILLSLKNRHLAHVTDARRERRQPMSSPARSLARSFASLAKLCHARTRAPKLAGGAWQAKRARAGAAASALWRDKKGAWRLSCSTSGGRRRARFHLAWRKGALATKLRLRKSVCKSRPEAGWLVGAELSSSGSGISGAHCNRAATKPERERSV